jgi:hypothetical protein
MFLSGKDLIMYRLNKVKELATMFAITFAAVVLMVAMFVLSN